MQDAEIRGKFCMSSLENSRRSNNGAPGHAFVGVISLMRTCRKCVKKSKQ